MRVRTSKSGRQHISRQPLVILVRFPIVQVLPKGTGKQSARDAARKGCGGACVAFCSALAERNHQLKAGIGVVFLGCSHLGKGRLHFGPAAGAAGPSFSQFHQISPLIAPRADPGKKLIDPGWIASSSPRHY